MITAALVKELRDKTNVGMMDCKAALAEAEGDIEKATELLRKKGIAKAAKKSDREANEGLVQAKISADGKTGVLIEVNCETDFVAKNDKFGDFVNALADKALAQQPATTEEFLTGDTGEDIKAKVLEVGENLQVKRVSSFAVEGTGALGSYIHMNGKVGVLAQLEASQEEVLETPEVQQLLKDICLQAAFVKTPYLKREELPAQLVEKEREIYSEQLKAEGKPEAAIAKIVEGKLGKLFFAQHALLESAFVKDNSKSVAKLIEEVGANVGDKELSLSRFACFSIGS